MAFFIFSKLTLIRTFRYSFLFVFNLKHLRSGGSKGTHPERRPSAIFVNFMQYFFENLANCILDPPLPRHLTIGLSLTAVNVVNN